MTVHSWINWFWDYLRLYPAINWMDSYSTDTWQHEEWIFFVLNSALHWRKSFHHLSRASWYLRFPLMVGGHKDDRGGGVGLARCCWDMVLLLQSICFPSMNQVVGWCNDAFSLFYMNKWVLRTEAPQLWAAVRFQSNKTIEILRFEETGSTSWCWEAYQHLTFSFHDDRHARFSNYPKRLMSQLKGFLLNKGKSDGL